MASWLTTKRDPLDNSFQERLGQLRNEMVEKAIVARGVGSALVLDAYAQCPPRGLLARATS